MPRPIRTLLAGLSLAALLGACCTDGCGAWLQPTPGPSSNAAPSSSGSSPGAGSGAPTPAPTPAPTQPAPARPDVGTWIPIDAAGGGPPAREDHTWTVDESGDLAYLFGGRGGGETFGDLWVFDLEAETWQEVKVAGPTPDARFGHEAVWLPGLGLAVTLGQAPSGFFDDIWLFDPATSTWAELPAKGNVPVARYGSCSGRGPDGRLWISHGFTEDGARFSDSVAYDLTTEAWTDVTPLDGVPRERCLHACWWTSDGRFVLYGGQTTGVAALGDLWALTTDGSAAGGHWAEVADPGPDARQLAAVGSHDGFEVLFGGRGLDRSPLDDLWVWDEGTARFARIQTRNDDPPARSGAALVDDAARDRMLLFGGEGQAAFDDIWELVLE